MDRTNKKLVSNMIYSGLGQLLLLITPIITTPYVARVFNPNEIGLYATSYALAMFFVQLAAFGIPIYGVRKIARAHTIEERTQFFWETWFLQFVTSAVSFLLYVICTIFFYANSNVYLLQSLLILTSIFDVSWFFIGIEEIKKNVFRNLLSKVVAVIAIFIFVKTKEDLLLYTVINIAGVLIGNLSMVFQLNSYITFKIPKFILHKREAIESFGLLVPQAVDSAKNAISRIILVYFSNYSESGFFDQGLKVVVMLSGIIQSVTNAITPRMTALLSENKKLEVVKIVNKYVSIANILATIIVCGVMSVSDYFVPIFFGDKYLRVSIIMKISSLALIFTTLSYFLGKGFLVSLSKDREYRKSTYFSAVSLVLSNLVLSSSLGSLGAAISFVLSTFIFLLCIIYYLKNLIDVMNIAKQLLYSGLVIFITVFVIEILKNILFFESNYLNFLLFGAGSCLISSLCYVAELVKIRE